MPARSLSFGILNDIFFQRKTMDEAFARAEGFEELESRDRALVRLLVSTVLKRARQMDAGLEKFLHEPIANLKPQQLINVFRLGIAQLVFLKTPPHAAVNIMVELAEKSGMVHQKSFVNAVLRRVAQEGIPPLEDRDAGRLNTPEWLWQSWMEDYGVEVALDIASANLNESPVDFTVRANPAEWAEKLEAAILPTGALRRANAGFVPGLPGFEDGAWWVQNAAAALPVQLLGDLSGKVAIDLCAAPGGKTAQLVAAGAKVIAVDRSSARVERLKENMQRLGMTVETVIADGTVWQPVEKADVVLLDAPCTATGTIRHQPDVLWLKDIRDQEKLSALQRRLMTNGLEMLKPGGELIYCTCSLQKAEGEKQTDWFLAQNLPVTLKKIEMKNISEMMTPRGEIRALPSHWKDFNGIDGFYVARFARI